MLRILSPRSLVPRIPSSCGGFSVPVKLATCGKRYISTNGEVQRQEQSSSDPADFWSLSFTKSDSLFSTDADILQTEHVELVTAAEAKNLQERVRQIKQQGQKPTPKQSQSLFFYFAANKKVDDMVVCYYDFKANGGVVTPLLCEVLMLSAGKTENKELASQALKDFDAIPHLKWTPEMVLISLKTFSLLGQMANCLHIYDKMYTNGIFPQRIHWLCMLQGAARAGCPQNFTRFYSRLLRKFPDNPPTEAFIQGILHDWGKYDDLTWKLSKKSNIQTGDYVHMVKIAQQARNYKLALQIMNEDIFKLDKQPTCQLYEVFLKRLAIQCPKFALVARTWVLRWREQHGVLEKSVIEEFQVFLTEVKNHFGDDLACIPPRPQMVAPTTRQTRKQRSIQHGFYKKKERYVSEWSDPEGLFDFVPQYHRRITLEKKAAAKKATQDKASNALDQEIEKAQQVRKEWRQLGFKGNSNLDESLLFPPRNKEDEEIDALREEVFPTGYDYFETTKEEEGQLMKKLARKEGFPPELLNEEQGIIEVQRDQLVRDYGDGSLWPRRDEMDSFRDPKPSILAELNQAEREAREEELAKAPEGSDLAKLRDLLAAEKAKDGNFDVAAEFAKDPIWDQIQATPQDEDSSGFFTQETIDASFPVEAYGPYPVTPGMEDSAYMDIPSPRKRDVLRRKAELEKQAQEALARVTPGSGEDIDVDETFGKVQEIRGEKKQQQAAGEEAPAAGEDVDVDQEFEKIVAWREKMLKERKRPHDNE